MNQRVKILGTEYSQIQTLHGLRIYQNPQTETICILKLAGLVHDGGVCLYTQNLEKQPWSDTYCCTGR